MASRMKKTADSRLVHQLIVPIRQNELPTACGRRPLEAFPPPCIRQIPSTIGQPSPRSRYIKYKLTTLIQINGATQLSSWKLRNCRFCASSLLCCPMVRPATRRPKAVNRSASVRKLTTVQKFYLLVRIGDGPVLTYDGGEGLISNFDGLGT